MKQVQGVLILNKTDVKNLVFALNTLEIDVGTRGIKSEDAKAKKAYETVKEIFYKLGVDCDKYF